MSSASDEFPVHVDRNHLPEPEWAYPSARIRTYAVDSEPDFPPVKEAASGSPNILLVLLDDVGFGWPSVNGGLVRMPTAERLAGRGLFYNQFHTTALCSPTRAALLTGRNHHTVSTGVIQEMATGYPGYSGIIPKGTATFAELLKHAGYTSAWFGKNHNVPDNQTSPAGPFENWPTHQGFDYFYGFISGETDQFSPSLYEGTQAVEPLPGPRTDISSPATSPTRRSRGSARRRRSRPTARSWRTSPPARHTRLTNRRWTGADATSGASTWVGTSTVASCTRTSWMRASSLRGRN